MQLIRSLGLPALNLKKLYFMCIIVLSNLDLHLESPVHLNLVE